MILRIPIELSDEQIKDFQQIYKKDFGVELTKEIAEKKGLNLIRFIALIIDKSEK